MLQAIKAGTRTRQASSLYCVWIKSASGNDAPLVAIWIDRQMRAFKGEFVSDAEEQAIPQDRGNGDGELPPCTTEFQPATDEER
jgi:hypothetical protein